MKFLITAGPTVEDIDPVRFISNRATGKLGVEMTKAALAAGQGVVFIHGPVPEEVLKALPSSPRLKLVPVRSAAQMRRAVRQYVGKADVAVMNAAVADFTPLAAKRTKIKKTGAALVLRLKPTADILRELGRIKKNRRKKLVLIGFALETGPEPARLKEARRKLRAKNLDVIILDSPAAMGARQADFTWLDAKGNCRRLADYSKRRLARFLVRNAISL